MSARNARLLGALGMALWLAAPGLAQEPASPVEDQAPPPPLEASPDAQNQTPPLQLAPVENSSPVECFARARDETFLNENDAFTLCRFARSSEPVDCFLRGRKVTRLDENHLVQLCAPVYRMCAPVYPYQGSP